MLNYQLCISYGGNFPRPSVSHKLESQGHPPALILQRTVFTAPLHTTKATVTTVDVATTAAVEVTVLVVGILVAGTSGV